MIMVKNRGGLEANKKNRELERWLWWWRTERRESVRWRRQRLSGWRGLLAFVESLPPPFYSEDDGDDYSEDAVGDCGGEEEVERKKEGQVFVWHGEGWGEKFKGSHGISVGLRWFRRGRREDHGMRREMKPKNWVCYLLKEEKKQQMN